MRGRMGKLFAVTLAVIAILSAIPVVTHTWYGSAISLSPPEDISTHGHAIDDQLRDTMVEAGVSILALGVLGQKAWANVYFRPAAPDAFEIQAQAGQFAFYFRYPGADGKLGALHPDKIDEGNSNFFGLDPANDVESRDDIVSGELAIPVDREVHLLMHAKDVGHSFYVRELRIQQDFVPGLDLSVHFTATK